MHIALLLALVFMGCKDREQDVSGLRGYGHKNEWTVESVRADFAKAKPVKDIFKHAEADFAPGDKLRGLDRVLDKLKKFDEHRWIFENIALIYGSKSLSRKDVVFPHLRIVAFSENRILAFTTKPDGEFYDFVESIEYLDGRYQFDFHDFSPEKKFAGMNADQTCGTCHGSNPDERRPIYGGYDFWPAFIGADGGFPSYPDYRISGHREKETIKHLCKSYHSKGESALPSRLEFFRLGLSNYCENIGLFKSAGTSYDAGIGRPRGFQRELAKMQSLRFYEQLTQPKFKSFYPAFAGVLLKCQVVDWFGKDSRKKFEEVLADTTQSVTREILRRAHLYFDLNVENFDRKKLKMKDNGDDRTPKLQFEYLTSSLDDKPKMMHLGLVDFPRSHLRRIDMVARMRFVAENMAGLNLKSWSISRAPAGSSYELSQNGQGDEIMQDVFALGMLDLALKPLGKSRADYKILGGYDHIGSFDIDGYPKADHEKACADLKSVHESNSK